MKNILICILISTIVSYSQPLGFHSKEVITFGPTWNVHFGGEETFHTFGIQIHHWNLEDFPYSFGGGLEFSKSKKPILYLDTQVSAVVVGTSHGLVFSEDFGVGYQGSIWGNYIVGGSYQYRSFGEGYYGPGMYIPIPILND